MEERTVIHNTFVIERTYPVSRERVFAAFADPSRKRSWFVESPNHEVEHHEMDFRVGGQESARFRFKAGAPVEGLRCSNDTSYLDIVPNRRLVFAATMTIGGNRISATLVTVELLTSEKGTHLVLTHQAAFLEGADGPEIRKAGWQRLLDRLADDLRR